MFSDETDAPKRALTNEEIMDLAAFRKVRFDVRKDDAVIDGEIVHTGLRIDLIAPAEHEPGPDCSHDDELVCPVVFEDLKTIARAVLPPEEDETDMFVDHFDHAVHVSVKRDYEEDIRLTIHVRHGDSSRGPVDEDQRERVDAITAALRDLGIPPD